MTEDQKRILEHVKDKSYGRCMASTDLHISFPCRICLVRDVCTSDTIKERKDLAKQLLMQTQDIIATGGTY